MLAIVPADAQQGCDANADGAVSAEEASVCAGSVDEGAGYGAAVSVEEQLQDLERMVDTLQQSSESAAPSAYEAQTDAIEQFRSEKGLE